jgi:hypothetical protein
MVEFYFEAVHCLDKNRYDVLQALSLSLYSEERGSQLNETYHLALTDKKTQPQYH